MEVTVSSIVNLITSFIGSLFQSWLPNVIEAISTNPVLLISVICIPVCGIAVGMFNRLIRSN